MLDVDGYPHGHDFAKILAEHQQQLTSSNVSSKPIKYNIVAK